MENFHSFLEGFCYLSSALALWITFEISSYYKTKRLIQELKMQFEISDAGLSTLIDDLDIKIANLTQDLENYHDVNRECLRMLICEIRDKQYRSEGWKPSRNKENMLEVAIEEAKTKKRRPGRPPRTHIKSE